MSCRGRSRPLRLAAAIGALGAAGLAAGVAEARAFVVRRVQVAVLPPGARLIRLLHISDAHLLPRQRAKLGFIADLAALEPDIVVDTGDNIASAEAIDALLPALGRLLERPGAFVFGSNDRFAPRFRNPLGYLCRDHASPMLIAVPDLPWERLGSRLQERGWADLSNTRAQFEVEGVRIEFRGADDAHMGRDDYASVAGPSDADVTIGVTHSPYLRVLDAMTADGADLILAGHTHGGQVCLPFAGALTTNCDLDPARAKGLSLHTFEGRTAFLHVSAGLGTSPFAPYRLFCRPEATLLTLTQA